jgi:hypothetical protein
MNARESYSLQCGETIRSGCLIQSSGSQQLVLARGGDVVVLEVTGRLGGPGVNPGLSSRL